jgi:hypothetical protein
MLTTDNFQSKFETNPAAMDYVDTSLTAGTTPDCGLDR